MTRFLASVSCRISGIFWDKHHQTSFPEKHILCISDKCKIPAVVNLCKSFWIRKEHRTDLLQIMKRLECPEVRNEKQHDSIWVKRATWPLLISFWLVVRYIFLRSSHFFSWSSFYILHQQILAAHTPQPRENGTKPGGSMGVASNTSLSGPQQDRRHQLVHRNAANAAHKTCPMMRI